MPWLLRLTWVGVLWLGWAAIDTATEHRSTPARAVATWCGGVTWLIGVAAIALPAVVTLTAVRVVFPLSIPAAGLAWMTGADALEGASFVAVSIVATIVAMAADTGRAFVQASAYGDEDRYVLRPPAFYAMASGLTWFVWAAWLFAGALLLAAERYLAGAGLGVLAVAGAVWAWPRWHRLARRWLVLVPVGLVVHDHLVLAETLMLRRQELAALRLAPAGTEAADLTGPAAGHAIEVVTTAPVTAIFAATRREPRGRAIHLTGCLVSPSRPGRFLTAAAHRHLPVG